MTDEIPSSNEPSDSELLQRYVEDGSGGAFRELVERHGNLVFSVALRRAGQWEVAEEAAQNVFRALAEKAPGLSREVILAGWLHKAALLEAANLQRAERTRARKMNDAADALAGDLESDAAFNPEDWAELTPFIDTAIGQLPTGDRDVVLLRFYQGMSYREIGARLGKNESSARKHTLRALSALRALLESRGVSLPVVAIGSGIAFGIGAAAPPTFAQSLAASISLPAAPATTVAVGGATASVAAVAVAALVFAAAPVAFQWHRHAQAEPARIGLEQILLPLRSQLSTANGRVSPATTRQSYDFDSVFAAQGAERLRRLALWLPGAGPDEVRAAAERLMIDQREPSANTSYPDYRLAMAWSAIFSRWAELDPQAMIAYAKAAPHPRYPHLKYEDLRQRAYSVWAKLDPGAAMAGAEGESTQVRIAVVNGLIDSDPESALAAASGLPIGRSRFELNIGGIFKALAENDPAAAAERTREIKDARLQIHAVSGVLLVWAEKDPQAALEFVESLESFEARAGGRDLVLRMLAEADPEAALPQIEKLPPGISRDMLMRTIARELASSDPGATTAWAETLTSTQDRRAAHAGMAIAFAKTDPAAAFAALEALNWDLRDPGSGINYEANGSGGSHSIASESLGSIAIGMISELARTDPRSALRYAAKIESRFLRSPLEDIGRGFISEDPVGAMAFATELEPGNLRNEFSSQVATILSASDLAGAMTWASQLGGKAGDQAQAAVFRTLAVADPLAAAKTIAELPQTPETGKAIRFLAGNWLQRDFSGASDWVQAHPDIDSIAPAVRPFIETWTERDPLAASEWVAALPEGAAMQQAAAGLVGWMINQPALDHQVALAWADRIDTDSERHFFYEQLVKDLMKTDSAAARKAIAATDLPEHVRERLLGRSGEAQTQEGSQ